MTISKERVILAREYILEREPKKKFSTFLCVTLNDQKIWLIDSENNIVKSYSVSSSKYGVGNVNDSFQTPCGLHIIEKKIGDDLPINTILKGRKVLENGLTTDDLNDPKYEDFKKQHFENCDDIITSRILWLKGCEPGLNLGENIDTYNRYIYIHGTLHEDKIGKPASHGCIRMKNTDVIELYDLVQKGTFVNILDDVESI